MYKLFIREELVKASEAGTFRGGDPEELQFKKEEKLRESKESGQFDLDKQEAEDQAEQADPGEVEAAIEKETEKKREKEEMAASLNKAGGLLTGGGSFEQNTFVMNTGDYNNKDEKEPHKKLEFEGKTQEPVESAPPRQGENQNKIYSQVCGKDPVMAPAGPPSQMQGARMERMREAGKLPISQVYKALEILRKYK